MARPAIALGARPWPYMACRLGYPPQLVRYKWHWTSESNSTVGCKWPWTSESNATVGRVQVTLDLTSGSNAAVDQSSTTEFGRVWALQFTEYKSPWIYQLKWPEASTTINFIASNNWSWKPNTNYSRHIYTLLFKRSVIFPDHIIRLCLISLNLELFYLQ